MRLDVQVEALSIVSVCFEMTFPAPLPFAPIFFPVVASETSWIEHHTDLIESFTPSSGFMSLFDDLRCPVVMFPAAPPAPNTDAGAGDIEMASLKEERRQSFFAGLASRISAAMGNVSGPEPAIEVEPVEDQIKFLEIGQEVTWRMAGESSKKV